MRKMLTEVNVLGVFTSPNDVVAPFDARGVVLVHRGVWGLSPMYSRRFRRYISSIAISAAAEYSALAVDKEMVFCIFDLHSTMVSLNQAISPVVERQETLFPQSESTNPSSPEVPSLLYVSLKLGFASKYPIT
jgi:hypothetical protein